MKLHRVNALILRHLYGFRHSFDKFMEVLFFPVIDLLLWGMTSEFFQHSAMANGFKNPAIFVVGIVSAIIFWTIAARMGADIPFGLLDDLWSRNLINLFSSPLTLMEWITASVVTGFLKAFISSVLMAVLAFFFYNVNILHFGLSLFVLVFLLMASGLWVSLFITGLIMRYGQRIQAMAWSFGWIILPFSAIYYPVSILPHWVQHISWLLPLTYLFESARSFIFSGTLRGSYLWACLGLNLVYISLAGLYLRYAFKVRLRKGILKLQG